MLWTGAAAEIEVVLKGVEGAVADNVRAQLTLYQERAAKGIAASRVRLLYRRAESEILAALRPYGFYRATLVGELQEIDPDRWRTSFQIEPGLPIRLQRVDVRVQGAGAADQGLASGFPQKQGDVLDQGIYTAFKRSWLELALERGYLDARFATARIDLDLDAYQAEVTLVLDSGHRYRFGEVTFQQQRLDDDLLQRFQRFADDQDYHHRHLLQLRRDLLDSGYFDSVDVVPQRDGILDGRIPVIVALEPHTKDLYRFGIGYATDVGPRLSFEWRRRIVNSRGHSARIETIWSPVDSRLAGQYRIPLEDPARDFFAIEPRVETYDTKGRQGQIASVDLYGPWLLEKWRRVLGVGFEYEDYQIAEEDTDYYAMVPFAELSRVRNDGLLYTRKGYRLKLRLAGALDGLLAQSTFLQGSARGKWVWSPGEDYRLISRFDLGATWADRLQDLPASRRFFAGGDNSLRGFALDSLGPRDDQGNLVGGRYLATASVEIERRIDAEWSGALFYDFGNAWDPDYRNQLGQGIGLGVRWLSPIGQVRVDLAWPLGAPEQGVRLPLSVGPDL